MLLADVDEPDATSATELRAEYERHLASIVRERSVSSVAASTGIDESTLNDLLEGRSPSLSVEEAASIMACTEPWPETEAVMLELRDTLMLRMSSAVMDVDSLSMAIEDDLDATAIQQRIEGRHRMTLDEYAKVVHAIAEASPG